MFPEIIKEILFQSIGKLLPWLRRKIYPVDEFIKDVNIDVRHINPLTFCLTCDIPYVSLYLEIYNKSQYVEMTLEKMYFDIWINSNKGSQPVIRQGKMISHQRVGKKKTEELYWATELTSYQVEFLRAIKDSKELSATLHINYDISSEIYEISQDSDLEKRQCKIE